MRYHFYKYTLIASSVNENSITESRFEGVINAKTILQAEIFLLNQFEKSYDSIHIQSLFRCPQYETYMVSSNLTGTTITMKDSYEIKEETQ